MTDILLFICLISGGFLVGTYFSNRVKRKHRLLSDLLKYIDGLKSNVNGRQLELAQFNVQFEENCCDEFADCLRQKKCNLLASSQRSTLENFFSHLDCVSGEQLLQQLDFYRMQFEGYFHDSTADVRKASIFVKLGMLGGAMLGVLLV